MNLCSIWIEWAILILKPNNLGYTGKFYIFEKTHTMKPILLALMLCCLNGVSQVKFDTYTSTFLKKDFNIEIAKSEKENYILYIGVASLDKLSKEANLMVSQKANADFKQFLKGVQETYVKWKETAEQNKVTELNKTIKSKSLKLEAAFFYGSKWNFDFDVILNARVQIIENKILLIISSGKLESSSNQFTTHDGVILVFSEPKEVDDFINKLNEEKAIKATEEKEN